VKVTKLGREGLRGHIVCMGVLKNVMFCRRENCREQKVVHRSLFSAQWEILVGDLEIERKY
jgi:hypothetical protein